MSAASAAGLEWSSASDLLLEASAPTGLQGSRWLLLGCEPAVAVALAETRPESSVRWVATDVQTMAALRQALAYVGGASVEICDDPVTPIAADKPVDVVVLHAPPERDLARRWLAVAATALVSGGHLLLAGANDAGIRSVVADAERLFGPLVTLDYRRRHRVARLRRDAVELAERPVWLTQPGIAPGTWQSIDVPSGDTLLRLDTLPGVFAAGRLDPGTALLLDHLAVAPGERVLDIGCGAGIIGLAAARRGAGWVDLVDADLLAVAAARRNLTLNDVVNGGVLASDVYDAVRAERYDLVVSNPPFHRGKVVDQEMPRRLITEAPSMLTGGGRLVLVANAFLAYDQVMRRVFSRVETVAATRQYHVLLASAPR